MKSIDRLLVNLHGRHVGTLALTAEHVAAFQYSADWMQDGFSISPLRLPRSDRVFVAGYQPFEGLFGVFDDSLPDGWGRLLVDRVLRSRGEDPELLDPLQRLALVGSCGKGALEYLPDLSESPAGETADLDNLADACAAILEGADADGGDLDTLYRLGGSSGGARPKVQIDFDGEPWIIKFPAAMDSSDIGYQECRYNRCARDCGIRTAPVRLFGSKCCSGYFGTRRFDRRIDADGSVHKVHMVSAGGLLDSSHRIPALDYHDLMKLTQYLTRDMEEVWELYRRMCFNVFAHNRDDHSRNFSYLYDEVVGRWTLSPAYDMTRSSSLGGEHATTVDGNGRNPDMTEILAVAGHIGLPLAKAGRVAEEIREIVHEQLPEYINRK